MSDAPKMLPVLDHCPFCGSALVISGRGVNPRGQCPTEGCAGGLQAVLLDDPRQVAAWNRRQDPPAEPITEEWLKASGFKWHRFDRQPEKHWLLWLGNAAGLFASFEDIGLELAPNVPGEPEYWFCWFRGDSAGRYHRFIHVRHIATTGELVKLIEAISGHRFDPANALYGSLRTPDQAARIRAEDERLDRQLNRTSHPWGEAEKDSTRGRALPEHLDHHIKTVEHKK